MLEALAWYRKKSLGWRHSSGCVHREMCSQLNECVNDTSAQRISSPSKWSLMFLSAPSPTNKCVRTQLGWKNRAPANIYIYIYMCIYLFCLVRGKPRGTPPQKKKQKGERILGNKYALADCQLSFREPRREISLRLLVDLFQILGAEIFFGHRIRRSCSRLCFLLESGLDERGSSQSGPKKRRRASQASEARLAWRGFGVWCLEVWIRRRTTELRRISYIYI